MRNSGYHYNLAIKFYDVAARHSEKIAISAPVKQAVSYALLNTQSNQLARYLLSKSVKQGDVVAIFNEKSNLAFALMLACLKIGAVYTNLDISSPWPRVKKILDTCVPDIIFIDQAGSLVDEELKASYTRVPVINLYEETFAASIASFGVENLKESRLVHGGNPAYIMFTSGSTGFPKGAVMSHNNVLNFTEWARETFNVVSEDILTNANPIYFDNSVFDFYTSIFNGATLVPLSHELVKNPTHLVQAINASGCTIWFSVPSLLVYLLTTKALSEKDFKDIRRISFGGEGFPKNKLKQLYDMFGHRVTLFNVYGPTECTCICSSYIISEKDFENMNELAPLGNIAPNFGYEILPLDEHDRNFGELALTGPCVGLGYYNDKERTAAVFVQNPNKKFHQRMYKTGDVVQKAENGWLYFKGRVDNQVKHMGYRIELEEIEAAFSTLDYVNEVGVIYQKISAELGQIKAFVSISNEEKSTKDILADIRSMLPPYMVPRSVSVLEVLPKNRNGKIDRKQLAEL